MSNWSNLIGSDAFGHQHSHKLFQRSGMTGRWLSTNCKMCFLIQWWNTQRALSSIFLMLACGPLASTWMLIDYIRLHLYHRNSWKFWAAPHCWLLSLGLHVAFSFRLALVVSSSVCVCVCQLCWCLLILPLGNVPPIGAGRACVQDSGLWQSWHTVCVRGRSLVDGSFSCVLLHWDIKDRKMFWDTLTY